MIGGVDIVIPAVGVPASLDACARVVQRQWPHARFENAESGEKFTSYGDIPMGKVRHLLVYADAGAESMWEEDSPDSPVNSMIYLILSSGFVTVVVDDPTTGQMPAMLDGIRSMLNMDILHTGAACKKAEAA